MSISKEEIKEAYVKAMQETLENMAFEQALLLEEPIEADELEDEKIWAKLDMIDPVQGILYIKLCKDCAESLAENILGMPEDEEGFSETMITDTVAELINTIAGRFMRSIVPEDYEFQIGLPETGKGDLSLDKKEFLTLYFETAGRTFTAGIHGDNL